MPWSKPSSAPSGPSPFARGPTGLSGAVTLGLGLALLGLMFVASLALPSVGRALSFERAPDCVARAFERRLELGEALSALPEWEQSALAPFVPVGPDTPEGALQAFRSVIERGHELRAEDAAESRAARERELNGLRARRAVLLAGQGRLADGQGDLDELERNGQAAFVVAVRALERGGADAEALTLAGDGWIGRSAQARARGEPRPEPGAGVHAALKAARAQAIVVVIGLAALLVWLARGRPDVTLASVAIPAPWTPQTGFGVLVRAGFLALVVLFGFGLAGRMSALVAFAVPLASLPLAFLVHLHLARPNRISFGDLLGLPARGPTLVLAILALFALERIGGGALARLAVVMGASEPWVFQVDAFSLFASDAAFVSSALASLAFGVVAMELAFRGVLFPSLRHVHGPVHSAVLAGLLFSAVHMGSLPSMLALAWVGFARALSVERTRSLVPAIASAAIAVVLDTVFFALLYR